MSLANIYFELTEAFNRERPTVALASGQAVVFYRIAIMSKDGDWVIREAPEACDRVLAVLESRAARYHAHLLELAERWLPVTPGELSAVQPRGLCRRRRASRRRRERARACRSRSGLNTRATVLQPRTTV